jgi:hypothetical protein
MRRWVYLIGIYVGLVLIVRGVILDSTGKGITWQAIVGAIMFGVSLAFYVEDD